MPISTDHDSDAFGGWVHVKSDDLDPDSLLQALKAGDYYSSQGPRIDTLSIEGSQLRISCSPVDRISVTCGVSRSVVKSGRAITHAEMDVSGLDQGWLLEKPSDWLRITLIDNAGKRAWTNPIWRDGL